ncbi:sensor histidine kinase [Streptomyces sp. NBC_00133]|uniref:sensor histidine kinase n=1 Tax=Streptomyces sp. NBC_00133 TaxID=2903624 RepID=UPI0038648BB4
MPCPGGGGACCRGGWGVGGGGCACPGRGGGGKVAGCWPAAHFACLGLSIVRKLTEAHGGTVTMGSTPDTGTVVTLHLPA